MTAGLLELRGVAKRYGPVRALAPTDLRIGRGEAVGILGANGAGKTTLLRIVAGLVRPTAGDVLLDGQRAEADARAWRRRLGHVSHHLMLHESLTTRENLAFAARLHGLDQALSRADRILRTLDLSDRADEPVRQLSRGLQQRAAVARALLHDPDVLLLDEPWTGLDQQSGDALCALLDALLRRERTVIVVSHDMARLARTCGRAILMRAGRVVEDMPAGGGGVEALDLLARSGARAPGAA